MDGARAAVVTGIERREQARNARYDTGMALRAAVYVRISSDREGESLGVARQREDCLRRVEREGWTLVHDGTRDVFEDNDISASSRSTKKRPAYTRLLEATERGEVDVILAYSTSRLTRRVRELEDLIQLHEKTGVQYRTVVSGDDDLATADGRYTARIKASGDAAESDRISERVSRAARQRREAGLRHGGFPPYGYRNAPGGRLEVDPERAAIVREAARRVLAGESLYGVYVDLNRRGIVTAPSTKAPKGARWHRRTLKRVLTEPSTIGHVRLPSGELRQVTEPLIAREDWDRLNELLYDPARTADRTPDWSTRRKYVLSGLLRCSACGHHLSGSLRRGSDGETRKSWICATATGGCGKIRIDNDDAELFVVRLALAVLDVAAVRRSLSQTSEPDASVDLRRRIGEDERRVERLGDDYADDVIDRATYERQRDRLGARLATNRTALAELMRTRPQVIETGGRSLEAVWDEHDVPWRRDLLARVLESVTVEPFPAGMASTLTRRKAESKEDFAARSRVHRDDVLRQRVRLSWRTEPVPTESAPKLDEDAFAHLSDHERVALWASRMEANRPVQLTGVELLDEASALLTSTR